MPRITDVPVLPPASTAPDQAAEHSAPAPPATAPGGPQRLNRPQRPKQPERHRGHAWARLVSPVAVVLLWQLVSSAGLVSAQKLPPPVTVWRTAVSLVTTDSPAYGTLQGAMLVSLQRMAIGFAFGAVAAVGLALVAGLSRVGEDAVDPLMQILRTLPLFGLIPVFIVWFGIGELPKVILIALGAAIPLYLNTFAGIRGVDARQGTRSSGPERPGRGRPDRTSPGLAADPVRRRGPAGRAGPGAGARAGPAAARRAVQRARRPDQDGHAPSGAAALAAAPACRPAGHPRRGRGARARRPRARPGRRAHHVSAPVDVPRDPYRDRDHPALIELRHELLRQLGVSQEG